MPIYLNTNADKVERLEIGDSAILHRRATAGDVQKAIEEARDPDTGRVDTSMATSRVLADHVTGWENVLDADGNLLAFDPDLVPMFVDALGYSERLRLDGAVTSGYREAAASGKDSTTGSNGNG